MEGNAMILGFLNTHPVTGKETNFVVKILDRRKKHSIRLDLTGRWKAGNKIHYSTDVRTRNQKCFKKGICTATQRIHLTKDRQIIIDNRILSSKEIEQLSVNDGLDSVADFWDWFDRITPCKPVIIHWTDLRY